MTKKSSVQITKEYLEKLHRVAKADQRSGASEVQWLIDQREKQQRKENNDKKEP